MILYAFACSAAQHELEAFFNLGAAPDHIDCPDHESPARRLLSKGAFSPVPGGYALTARGGSR